jgi:hypothetical protein
MRSAGNFSPEWGYLSPTPSFMRTVRVVLVATAIGATAGAGVVVSLIDRPATDGEKTALAPHAIVVTSMQAVTAPAEEIASPTPASPAVVSTPVTPAPVTAVAPIRTPAIAPPQPAAIAPNKTPGIALAPRGDRAPAKYRSGCYAGACTNTRGYRFFRAAVRHGGRRAERFAGRRANHA